MAGPDETPPAEAAPEQAEAPRKNAASLPLRIAKWVGGILLTLVLLIGGGVFVLDTGPGHRFVADQIARLEFQNGMRIRIGRIEGSLFDDMTLRALSIHDTKGEFLFSPEVKVSWRPFDYLKNHVDIRSATAARMTLRRVPAFRATPPSDEPLLPDLDIDIGSLKIDRFVAEPAVSGERRIATIAGKAHIASRRAQVQFDGTTVAIQAAPGQLAAGGGDRIALTLDAVPESNRLDIKLTLDAPKGGVIGALAGISDPLAVRLDGRGDWKAWNGKLDADLSGTEFARLTLAARDGVFTVKGPTQVARLAPAGPTATLLGPITNLDLTAALEDRRATLSGTVSSDAFNLATNGVVNLADSTFQDLKLALVLLKPSALAENLSGSGLRALLTLNDGFATPRVAYTVDAARLTMNDMGLERLSARGAARIDADRIMVPVDASVARITGLDTVAGGTLANVRLNGNVAIDGPRILSDDMRIRSDRIDGKLILLADTSKGFYTGAVNGRIDRYRIESVGLFNIETRADLKTVPNGFAMVGNVRARSTQLFNSGVRDFLGGNAVAASDVSYGPDGVIRFANLRVSAPQFRLAGGQGSYSPNGQIVFNGTAFSNQYGKVGVRVAGTVSDPQATINAERPGLGIGLANLNARITGAPGGYRLAATGDTDYGPLTANVVLKTGRQLAIQIDEANLSGIAFAGSLVQTPTGPFAGQLTANGSGLNGLVRLGAAGKYQEALVNLRATDTVLPGPANLSIGSAIVDARIVLYDKPYVVADAQLAQTHYGSFDLNAARVLVDYRDGRGTAKALVEGTGGAPFRLAINADLQPNLWRAMLDGRMRGVAVKTASPARIIPKAGGYELLPTKIDVGSGSLRLAGTYGDGIKVESRLDRLNLAMFNAILPGYGFSGRATGSLDFSQPNPSAFPRADARLTIDDFTRTTAVAVSQPVDVNFVGKLLPDGGEARAVIRRRGSVIGQLQASLRPLPPGAGPWTTRLLSAPLGGGIRYNGPAETLVSFGGLADQSLTGPIGLAADFSCKVSAPCLNGVVRANNLVYENQTYGTRLTNLALSGRFGGDRLEVESLTARAGNGTISAKGFVSLAAASGYPMDVTATLQNARLARSEAISGSATGTLRLTKTAGETALLSGELRLPETRYQIIRQGSAEVPELTGVRFKPPRGRQLITGNEPAKPGPGLFSLLRLDLKLRAPEELYVSGMGLESEWRANFSVTGTSAAPVLAGQVELIRGTLGFAGRSFDLSEGHLDFTGGRTIDPVIAMVATEDVDDVTVNVNVSGRAFNPQITFSSVPGLPQDEILSRVLFGSSISSISTLQAVQLASSLNSLRGTGGGLNPLGKLRSATGIDRLRILSPDETTGRGTALAAGQYLTDDIYVELVTDARGFTATQLEVSLTKWLSVMSQAGGSGLTQFNVRVKKNY